ncbi:MAG: DUF937 domain-containing protein [Altererythrobacter sp.]|nr:DUF937 domain-containing protein [Altererythrobacter sp.]
MGANANPEAARAALEEISSGDGFDLGNIVSQFSSEGGDIAGKVSTWLGDGANEAISAEQVQSAIGSERISSFAEKLGVSQEAASSSLSEVLPTLIDKSSSGGELLAGLNSAGGLRGLMSKVFGK